MCKPGPNDGAPCSQRAALIGVMRTSSGWIISMGLGVLGYGIYVIIDYDEGIYLATGILCVIFGIIGSTLSARMPYQGDFKLDTCSYAFMFITAIATIVLIVMTSICINWWVKWVDNVVNRPDGWEWWDYFFIVPTSALLFFELILFLVSFIIIVVACCLKYKGKKKEAEDHPQPAAADDASPRSDATRSLTAAESQGEALEVAQLAEAVPAAGPSHITVNVVANDGERVNVTNNPDGSVTIQKEDTATGAVTSTKTVQ